MEKLRIGGVGSRIDSPDETGLFIRTAPLRYGKGALSGTLEVVAMRKVESNEKRKSNTPKTKGTRNKQLSKRRRNNPRATRRTRKHRASAKAKQKTSGRLKGKPRKGAR